VAGEILKIAIRQQWEAEKGHDNACASGNFLG